MKNLHNWDLSYSQAAHLQTELAEKVQFEPLQGQPRLIVGLDCALSKDGQRIIAACVLLKLPDFEILRNNNAIANLLSPISRACFPSVKPPSALPPLKNSNCEPDVFIIDGQGIAHPRRLGIASHLGLFFDKPTIGCAKSRLFGSFEEPAAEKGSYSPLKDGEEVIGAVVRTRTNVEPVFVSVGNKCTLEDAIEVILSCVTKYRLPEPTRIAHQVVSRLKQTI